MIEFSLFRIPVSIHWMFFLLTAFIGGAVSATTPEDMLAVLVFMAAAFVSILIHEFGHALTGLKLGAPSASIHLHGLGGLAQFPGARFSRSQSILMTAAGPGASIALAILAYIVLLALGRSGMGSSGSLLIYFLNIMVGINVFWTIVNLFPVLPLDGGRILADILGPDRLKITCIISFITLGILTVLLWTATRSLFNLAIMALLGSHTWQVYKNAP